MAWTAPESTVVPYLNFIEKILDKKSGELFEAFKSNPAYNSIVGMSQAWQGEAWWKRIKNSPDIFKNIENFRYNDMIGAPPAMCVCDNYLISANTLRHLNTLCDIYESFGNLNGSVIFELGIGYGATAFMINKFYHVNYHIKDFAIVERFALTYLMAHGILVTNEEPPIPPDLFISEFCLSELDDKEIYQYYERYIKDAKRVYIASNMWDTTRKNRLIDRLKTDFSKLKVTDEFPKTHWDNYIIIGSKV